MRQALDGTFLSLVVQEAQDRNVFLRAVTDLLRPRGWCAILEWYQSDEREESMPVPPLEDPIKPEDLETLVRSAGFRLKSVRSLGGGYYIAQMWR